jgi:hypothetical protein
MIDDNTRQDVRGGGGGERTEELSIAQDVRDGMSSSAGGDDDDDEKVAQ